MQAVDDNNRIDTLKRSLQEFLEDDALDGKYVDRIRQTIQDGKFRLVVNVNDLRNWNREFTNGLMTRPREYMVALQLAATESVQNIDPTLTKYLKTKELQIGFEGSFGRHSVSPRSLSSSYLNQLVEVEGIVTKCSSIRPKILKSVHYCMKTKEYSSREYRDDTSLDIGIAINGRVRLPTGSAMPNKDAEGNPLDLEYGLCSFKDFQTVILQEMPERSKVGQLPRSIEVVLEYDLADRVKPGDRIQCVGVYRPLPRSQMGLTNGLFPSVLICNNVGIIGKEIGAVHLTGTDVKNIRELSQRRNVLDILSNSMCPSIFGHDFIKKALILQLLGGSEKNLPNGHHLRGDINVLMVGDPSTAKSQLLRAMIGIAPLAISTTGRGSSGVGLTAAVTMDSDTNERRLEAGAMVLADRGVVCIDEFDKMSENDRVAIHEVMEQQTVTIAKAGIHASLNARCSVLAAANPVYGQYDRSRRPQDNIGLPDSLLSRFDLLFIVLDQLDPVLDKRLSQYIVKSHQYRKPGTLMEPEPLNQKSKLVLDTFDAEEETLVYQRLGNKNVMSNSQMHNNTTTSFSSINNNNNSSSSFSNDNNNNNNNNNTGSNNDDILSQDFLRKYIHFAKNRIFPTLSDDAMELITTAYASMRSKQTQRTLPVTARSLETIIRLSNASAKSRLSQSVDEEDVETALELLNFVLYHEIGTEVNSNKNDQQQQQQDMFSTNKENNNNNNNNNATNNSLSMNNNKRNRITDNNNNNNNMNIEDDDDDETLFASKYMKLLSSSNVNTSATTSSQPRTMPTISSSGMLIYSEDDVSSLLSTIDVQNERYLRVLKVILQISTEKNILENIVVVDIIDKLKQQLQQERRSSSGNNDADEEEEYSGIEIQAMLRLLERNNKIMYLVEDGLVMLI